MNNEEVTPKYTCGFLFDPQGKSVVLIRKTHPVWQQGKWNGIGGKIEEDETPADCQRREFREEAGLDVKDWTHFATLGDMRGYRVAFFYAHSDDFLQAKTKTPEKVDWFFVNSLPETIPNLNWLIPMALCIKEDRAEHFLITETEKQSNEH